MEQVGGRECQRAGEKERSSVAVGAVEAAGASDKAEDTLKDRFEVFGREIESI